MRKPDLVGLQSANRENLQENCVKYGNVILDLSTIVGTILLMSCCRNWSKWSKKLI